LESIPGGGNFGNGMLLDIPEHWLYLSHGMLASLSSRILCGEQSKGKEETGREQETVMGG